MRIIGYSDHLSVRPGDSIEFKVSTDEASFDASLVRLVGGPVPGKEAPCVPVELAGLGRFPGRKQRTQLGSHADLPLPKAVDVPRAMTIQFWISPSAVELDRQQTIIATDAGLELSLKAGRLVLSVGDKSCSTAGKLGNHVWYFVAIRWSQARLSLDVEQVSGWAAKKFSETVETAVTRGPSSGLRAIRLAARMSEPAANHFNGKIEHLRLYPQELTNGQIRDLRDGTGAVAPLLAEWSFDRDIGTDRVVDVGPHGAHGNLFNLPTRGVRGQNWTGDVLCFAQAPSQYGAIAFHDDDLYDSAWKTDIRLAIPSDFASGVYALEVTTKGEKDSIVFFVRGGDDSRKDVLFLAPTNTYIAYGNDRLAELDLDVVMSHEKVLNATDQFILSNPFLGKSLYDRHTDGSGVNYSTRLRPILNMRPNYMNFLNAGPRHFAADLLTLGWLEKRGVAYDVAIDEDLDRQGESLLSRYKVLVTGTHPEYWSEAALKAVHAWLGKGGRLMYLGGNGFYWVTGLMPERRDAIEVRRGNAGTRTSDTPPGEVYLTTTGKSGGMWRHRGYFPQGLTGVGFASQGWGGATGYKRLDASYEGEGAAFFRGIDDAVIGDFGTIMGGAAGDEIDRLDYSLGTPAHALWLATSTGHSDYYQFAHEDMAFTLPGNGGRENPLVRSDIVAFDIEGGGKVFSIGSISLSGAMVWNDYNNNIAKLVDNALNIFLAKR